MTEFASRASRQAALSTVNRPKRVAGLPVLALVVLWIVGADTPLWLEASVGTLSATVLSAVSAETELAVAGALAGSHVPAALGAVRAEQENVRAEREGYVEFAEEVRSLSTAGQSAVGTTAQAINTAPGNRVLETVRETYRETVMSTPDYDREYGESFEEHVATEFGDDVAALVVDGNHLNGPLKRLLVRQARESARRRDLLGEALTVEERSLENASSSLEPVAEFLSGLDRTDISALSLSELVALDADLRTHRDRCRRVLEARQREIHTVNRRLKGETKTLTQEYLYRDLPVNFPVLSTTLEFVESLEETRSALVRSVCRPR